VHSNIKFKIQKTHVSAAVMKKENRNTNLP